MGRRRTSDSVWQPGQRTMPTRRSATPTDDKRVSGDALAANPSRRRLGLFSSISSSLTNITKSVTEEMSAASRAQSCDNLTDVDLGNFEQISRRRTVVGVHDHLIAHPPMQSWEPKPPPRRAKTYHGSAPGPARPPRPDWMKKTPTKLRHQLAASENATADDELVLPYASTVSIRSWAKPRQGNKPRGSDECDEIFNTEYNWKAKSPTGTKGKFDLTRAKERVDDIVSPQKHPGNSTATLTEVLEDVSKAMAESGTWVEARKIAQDRAVVKKVQSTLDSVGIKPNEASAAELLTALLSCFEE